MKFQFVGARIQDSATRRRRAQQVNRTREYRKRQRAREEAATINQQGEPLSDAVDSVAGNGTPEPERYSCLENEESEADDISALENFAISIQEVDDSTISTTEVDPYYEEEIVDISPTGEDECQRHPQILQSHVGESADLATSDANTDVEYATQKFAQQFLTGIHGCSAQSHRESLTAHIEAEGPGNHHRLDRLVAHDIPHTLDKEDILATEIDEETTELSPDQWQALFTGSTTLYLAVLHICIVKADGPTDPTTTTTVRSRGGNSTKYNKSGPCMLLGGCLCTLSGFEELQWN